MGIARVRYNYKLQKVCILNAMLLSIFNPWQMLNSNDTEDARSEKIRFPVEAYYAVGCRPDDSQRSLRNEAFSKQQKLCRKRARVVEKTEHALQFATGRHPARTVKRRRTKIEQASTTKSLEKSWSLVAAQLVLSLNTHAWLSNVQALDFILVEQQDRSGVGARAIFLALIAFYETKRTAVEVEPPTDEGVNNTESLLHLRPFVKICSSSNKLANVTTEALRTRWRMERPQTQAHKMSEIKVRALLKKHLHPPAAETANSDTYSKRKISSVDEITAFFCADTIKAARQQSGQPLPPKCDEQIVRQLAAQPVNAYAKWIVNQNREKNNVTDALLQAFAWIEQAELPAEP